eukprot:3235601-Rhodomonas_salina.1
MRKCGEQRSPSGMRVSQDMLLAREADCKGELSPEEVQSLSLAAGATDTDVELLPVRARGDVTRGCLRALAQCFFGWNRAQITVL